MATIDSNGVLFYQDSDNFTPPASLNLAQSNLSSLLGESPRFKKVANTTTRSALVTSIGLANITADNPLLVWRADAAAAAGSQLEYTTNGSTWNVLVTSEYLAAQDTGWITTGLGITVASNWSLTSYTMRRVGNRITGRLVLTFKGGSLSSDANGDFANAAIGTLPSGWRPGAFAQRCTLERGPGGATSNAWADPNGALTLVSSTLQSATVLATGQQYVLYLDHLI